LENAIAMDSLLECEVCMERYTEIKRRPRSLPCGHSMCHTCIKDSLKTHMGYLECPFCRHTCCDTPKTAEDFPATFAILRILEPEQAEPEEITNPSAPNLDDDTPEKKETQLAITESYVMSCKEKLNYLDQHRYELESQMNSMQKQIDEYMREVERKNNEIKNLNSQIEKELCVINEVTKEGRDVQVRLEELKLRIFTNENVEEVDEYKVYSTSQEWNLTVATLLDNSSSLDDIEKLNDSLMVVQSALVGDGKTPTSNNLENELKIEETVLSKMKENHIVSQGAAAVEDITTFSNKLEKELMINEHDPSTLVSEMERILQMEKTEDGMTEVFIPLQLLQNLLDSSTLPKITRLTLHLEVEAMSPLPDLPKGAFSNIPLFILGLHSKLEDHHAEWCGRFIGHILAGRSGRCNWLVLNDTHLTDAGACEVISSLASSGVCITECFKIVSSVGLYDQKETELRKFAKSNILEGWDFKWKMSDINKKCIRTISEKTNQNQETTTKFYVNL
ncbi:unnamed protein product, partial [Meganyctiphanes norvegica]